MKNKSFQCRQYSNGINYLLFLNVDPGSDLYHHRTASPTSFYVTPDSMSHLVFVKNGFQTARLLLNGPVTVSAKLNHVHTE